jgi:hypothetical protein
MCRPFVSPAAIAVVTNAGPDVSALLTYTRRGTVPLDSILTAITIIKSNFNLKLGLD